ncbi:hypothetical protein ATEIFO6365_0007003000 [Aspergillus terreus]|uniref:Nephrocystin 3-like N-terminal domain-containing protein n=1 Tax=Aspergillus terreus TaxID=33178 RepID=A0A5M3Z3U2_ASPTE|nr:hypothetical protein ATETN484_0009003000 [Aspergillus terreus]GFF17481.1 hypothetical protein ATEIFO6365_0007003000 [Aspergillus terreus]
MDLATAVAGFVSLGLQVSQNLLTYYDGWRHSREDVDDICNSVGEMRQMLAIMDEAVKRQSFYSCNGTDDFKRTVERYRKRKEVLGWLYDQDPFMLYQLRESRRHPGTCQWFLQGQEYLQWRSAGPLLWVKGEVGCGKSYLCSAVIEHLQSYCTAQSDNILLQFFFSFADAHRPNPLLCLSSLLRQMCVDERVLQHVEELYEKFSGPTARRPLAYDDIELALDSAIECLKRCKKIYIVLDALDELPNDPDEYQRSRVLNWIMETSNRYRHVRILFASRSNSSSRDIEDFAATIPSIGIVSMDAMSNRDDMFSYLEAQFKRNRVLSKVPGHSLSKTLNDMISLSGGMFLWVHLQMIELTKLPTPRLKDIDRILKSMPPRLDSTCTHRRWTLRTPLGWAAALGLESVVNLLLSQRPGDLHVIQDIELNPEKCFQVQKPCEECCILLRFPFPPSGTALMKAVEFGHTSIVQLLIDHGADINSSGEFGDTALLVACRRLNSDLVKYLLDNGASPSGSLTEAIRGGSFLICELLLDAGAEVEEEIKGEIPLMVAAGSGYDDICQVLLDFGADVNRLRKIDDWRMRDPANATDALTAATMFGNVQTVELLLSKGAHVRGSALAYSLTGLEGGPSDEHREICNILIQHGADLNPDLGGPYNTPLAMALCNGWLDIARCMISKGARVEPSDPTCLSAGNLLVAAVSSADMTREILDLGVAADSPIAAVEPWAWEPNDDAGDFTTALQAAAYYGRVDTVKLLLANGADPNILGPPYGSALFSLFAGACHAIENHWRESQAETEEAYHLSVRERTVQIYNILQERRVQNVVPWGSLDYDAFRTCRRGIKYASIRTGIDLPRSIDEKTFANRSGGTFCRVVRSQRKLNSDGLLEFDWRGEKKEAEEA